MKALQLLVPLILGAGFLLSCESAPLADEKQARPYVLPGDPVAAWAEVQKLHQALRPPKEWRSGVPKPDEVTTFQKQVRETAMSFAGKAREFIERFPTNKNVGEARVTVVHALNHAVAGGHADAEKQLAAFVASVLADKSIPEDNRVWVLLFSGNAVVMKKVGMGVFTEGMGKLREEFETATVESSRAALKQFPKNSLIYTTLLSAAQRSKGERQKELATEVRDAPDALPGAKALAEHVLKGTRPYQIGRPLDIRFTTLDGREDFLVILDLPHLISRFYFPQVNSIAPTC
jgi:hypothetical protein